MTDRMALAAAIPRADRTGVVALLGGSAIIAWSGVLARFLDVGPLAGAGWRMAFSTPVLAVWAGVGAGGRWSRLDPRPFAFTLMLCGLAFAADVGSFHISLTGTTVANASFIGNVAPILAVVGGALFFGEHPQPRVWPSLALAVFGSWVMAGMVAPAKVGYGDAFALTAALCYATYLLIVKRLRTGLDGATATLWSAIVSCAALFAAAALHGETMIPTTALGWSIVVLLGVVSHALGQGLTSVAIGRAPVGLVALVILAVPPFSALLAWLVLREAMSAPQMAGGAVILAAVFLGRPR